MVSNEWIAYKKGEYLLNQELIRVEKTNNYESIMGRLSFEEKIKRWEKKLKEYKEFLEEANNPHLYYPIILVGGTSGKGSVAALISQALYKLGYKVGLHTSPYLQVATEKIIINNRLISGTEFLELIESILPICKKFLEQDTTASVHGMASLTIALEAFKRHKVDIAVIEAGCGGRYDLTALLPASISVITTIGPDHLLTLGPTLNEVAFHKAGLIRPKTPIITGVDNQFIKIIEKEASQKKSPLIRVIPSLTQDIDDFNIELAYKTLTKFLSYHISKEEFISLIEFDHLLSGRCEPIFHGSKTIIIDGAHNPQKLEGSLRKLYNKMNLKKFNVIFGTINSHPSEELIESLISSTEKLILTEPKVYGKISTPPKDIYNLAKRHGIEDIEVINEPLEALNYALNLEGNNILITGSLYLAGNCREKWYPSPQIIKTRDMWLRV